MTAGKRVVVSQYGEDPMDAVENFVSIEEQFADPEQLGPQDVLVGVHYAAVGWVDLLMSSGQYQHMATPPYCPGLEYSGQVLAVGSAVRRWKGGEAVISDGLQTGPRSIGDYQSQGGFASFAIAPESAIYALPKGFQLEQGCNFLGNYETAYHCLVRCGQLKAGETILIHGATGSTGLAAVQLAKLLGARVIATGRSPEKLELVKEQGADHVVLSADASGVRRFREEVKALTEGRGVEVVYDAVGGDISLESLRCMCFGGRFLIVGWAATPQVAKGKGGRGAPQANQLPTNLLMMKGLHVIGCPTVISTYQDPSLRPERLEKLFAWAEAGQLKPYVSKIFDLLDVKEALRAKWQSQYVGSIALACTP